MYSESKELSFFKVDDYRVKFHSSVSMTLLIVNVKIFGGELSRGQKTGEDHSFR